MERTTSQDMPAGRRPRRSIVAVALATLLAVPATATLSTPAAANPSPCATTATSSLSGVGNAGTPFQVSSLADLERLRADVLAGPGNDGTAGKFYQLTGNIDLANCLWTPIGTPAKPFEGTFDGLDGATVREITGLNVVGTANGNYGLFGATYNASIRNLTVRGSVSLTAGAVNARAGGLVGRANGLLTLERLVVDVDVSQDGNPNQAQLAIGGVVGFAGSGAEQPVSSGFEFPSEGTPGTDMTVRAVQVTGDVTSPATGSTALDAGGLVGSFVRGSLTVEPSLDPQVAADPAFEMQGDVEARQRAGGMAGSLDVRTTAERVRIVGDVTAHRQAGGMFGPSGGDVDLSDIEVTGSVAVTLNTAGGIFSDLYVNSGHAFAMRDVTVSGDVSAASQYAGGLIGYLEASEPVVIEDATVSGDVSANFFVGGAIGDAYDLSADLTLRRVTVSGDVVVGTRVAGGVVGTVTGSVPTVRLTVEDSMVGTASSRVEATAEGFVGGVVGQVGASTRPAVVSISGTTVAAAVVAGQSPAACFVGDVTSGSVAVTNSSSRPSVTIGGVVTQCESTAGSVAAPAAGPSFVAPGGVTPTLPVGSGEWVQADGSSVPLVVSSPGRNQVRYVADGVQVTFTGGAGSDASRGLVADQNGEVVCEVCLQLAAGQVIEVWMFSEPRLVAAHLTDGLPCQRFSVPVVSPLDGGGPVVAGAHTLQLALPTSNGMQAVNVGVTVGGRVPGSVPAGEGPVLPVGWLLALGLAAAGALAVRRTVAG